jgi:hypothetical protein
MVTSASINNRGFSLSVSSLEVYGGPCIRQVSYFKRSFLQFLDILVVYVVVMFDDMVV